MGERETPQAEAVARLIEARTQLFALCEATADECHDKLQELGDGGDTHSLGFYRGRKLEAKAISRAMQEVFRELLLEAAAALAQPGMVEKGSSRDHSPPATVGPLDRAAITEAELRAYERAAEICEEQAKGFLDPAYAYPQPLGSFSERFACGECAKAIRAAALRTPTAPVDEDRLARAVEEHVRVMSTVVGAEIEADIRHAHRVAVALRQGLPPPERDGVDSGGADHG